MEQQPEIQPAEVQQRATPAIKQVRLLPTSGQRHRALAHVIALPLSVLGFSLTNWSFIANHPNLILFSQGFFTSIFFLILMDVISFIVPHWKKGAPPIPLFEDLDMPTKITFWIGVVVVSFEGYAGWCYGWEGKTGLVFGLGALLTGVWYEHGMRKYVQWALD